MYWINGFGLESDFKLKRVECKPANLSRFPDARINLDIRSSISASEFSVDWNEKTRKLTAKTPTLSMVICTEIISLEFSKHIDEGILLGSAFSLWAELNGYPVFHGCSIDIGSGVIGILGNKGAGKSTLAMSFVDAGSLIFGDDLFVPRLDSNAVYHVFPGVPQIRLSADVLRAIPLSNLQVTEVEPDAGKMRITSVNSKSMMASEPKKLVGVFEIRDEWRVQGEKCEISRYSPANSLLAFARHGFNTGLVDQFYKDNQRFHALGRIANSIPVFRLEVPKGLEQLPSVVRQITEFCNAELVD